VGTLAGAAALPFIGRGLDRWGPRLVILAAAAVFSVTLFLLSFASEILGLTAGFVFLRMAGQGTLTLAATTAVVKYVTARRGLAVGITAAVGSAGISLTPVFADRLIEAGGVAHAWRYEALAVLALIVPMVFLLPRHAPTGKRLHRSSETQRQGSEWTSRQAARTPIFWAITAALSMTGMLSTALAFHQISILGARGLTSTEAAANFIPQTVTAILATLVAGVLASRVDPRMLLAACMALLAISLAVLPLVSGVPSAVGYGLVLGAATGAIRSVEPVALARYFGTGNIGGIRGIMTAINVGSTALGPILFSTGHALTGNYTAPALVLAVPPVVVGLYLLICPTPDRNAPPR
jgi:MFS family permease